MQKLIVEKKFMAVEPCEINLNRFLVLIGEQASGKSTVAKLFYFFQKIPDEIFYYVMKYNKIEEKHHMKHINTIIINRFEEMFGPDQIFDITFYYNYEEKSKNQNYYRIFGAKTNTGAITYNTNISINLGEKLHISINEYYEKIQGNYNIINLEFELNTKLKEVFSLKNNEFQYLIASRNFITAFPDALNSFYESIDQKVKNAFLKDIDYLQKSINGSEIFIYRFIQWSDILRKYFKNRGGSFEKVLEKGENKVQLNKLSKISKKILKGTYSIDTFGENILIDQNQKVYLNNSSTGQQESLRILQSLYISIGTKNSSSFFVVEEPEAHLYPLSQKEVINAFALFINSVKESRLIITTHSPYVLACLNNLLFANSVANKDKNQHKKINNIIDSDTFLDDKQFSAYFLGGGTIKDENYCINLKDDETGLIKESYLDYISIQLGFDFQKLLDLDLNE